MRDIFRSGVLCVTTGLLLLSTAAHGQGPNRPSVNAEERVRAALSKLLEPVGVIVEGQAGPHIASPELATQGPAGSLELRIRWNAKTGATTSSTPSLTIVNRWKNLEPPPHLRSIELANNRLMAVAIDAQLNLKGWSVIPDPRIIRAEFPGPEVIKGQIVKVANPEFQITFPDDPSITEVRLYQPNWNGASFALFLLGKVELK